jgi:very-short-patch-repair endonuclease
MRTIPFGTRNVMAVATALQQDIARLLSAQDGLLSRRANHYLTNSLDWLVQQHRLVPVLPGVYALPARASDLSLRLRAVSLWDPDAVLLEEAAAFLTFWPTVRMPTIRVSAPNRRARPQGYTVTRRAIAAESIVTRRGLRCTAPAVTALDLSDRHGGDAIDAVLRSRQATLADLDEALRLRCGRRGNSRLRRLLLESRGNPWSWAERLAHRLLHEAAIEGWVGNYPVEICGYAYYVDIAFPDAKLALEIDGREFHTAPEVFEQDRWRQNDLINAGWRVLRFTPTMLQDSPQFVLATIRRALAG